MECKVINILDIVATSCIGVPHNGERHLLLLEQYTAQMASLSFLYSVYVTPKNMKRFCIPCWAHALTSECAVSKVRYCVTHYPKAFDFASTTSCGLEGTMQTLILVVNGSYRSVKRIGILPQHIHTPNAALSFHRYENIKFESPNIIK